jgi:hypothetical protein
MAVLRTKPVRLPGRCRPTQPPPAATPFPSNAADRQRQLGSNRPLLYWSQLGHF